MIVSRICHEPRMSLQCYSRERTHYRFLQQQKVYIGLTFDVHEPVSFRLVFFFKLSMFLIQK